jgi:hypothetical protein
MMPTLRRGDYLQVNGRDVMFDCFKPDSWELVFWCDEGITSVLLPDPPEGLEYKPPVRPLEDFEIRQRVSALYRYTDHPERGDWFHLRIQNKLYLYVLWKMRQTGDAFTLYETSPVRLMQCSTSADIERRGLGWTNGIVRRDGRLWDIPKPSEYWDTSPWPIPFFRPAFIPAPLQIPVSQMGLW